MSGHSMGSKIDTLSDKWGTCVFTMMKKRMKNIITRDNNNNKIKQEWRKSVHLGTESALLPWTKKALA
ncbi:hypothetical protein HanRHA438_Chr01g0024541 [Helianthus annuus]|uniref:Uncharacterized protein n=1 Tax=Helianthus annuus TaxID=4232 RepID=A0A9K3P396_HELAN|nr:hypothetical protein HanXRQr2_Chr01g0024031 [Helianthus annuus]KAJ0627099.1 hypothetical protein HanHA89_Chr01g0021441 [Helianthus annuus]KAJ0783412.1 hypothetical protein HanLR1_Chr01g0020041 [Helianthus annuus]KAJ0948205.1 hypothetical protein HanRHA438_Chr01g0024541 [Helianthus annuus]